MAKAGTLGRLATIAFNLTSRGRKRVRVIHTYHGHVFDGYFKTFSTSVFLWVERWLAKRTDALIAISPHIANDLVSTYRVAGTNVVRLIPLGLPLDRLLTISALERTAARKRLSVPDDVIVVSTVGRLTTIKQQTLFVEMAHRVSHKSDRFVFLVVGDGELRRDLQQRTKRLGIEHYVQFLGWRADLETIYAATDVFVLTSRNEGTPVALIEAMAAGVASVSTDVGGVRDVITGVDVGMLVPSGDADALTAAVCELADDEAKRQKLGRQARESVRERFHSRRLVRDITLLYQELLEPPSGDPCIILSQRQSDITA